MEFKITLTEAEYKALSCVILSPEEWINNAAHERCRVAIEQIVNTEIQRKLAAGETISGTKEDIVLAAPIKTLKELEDLAAV